MDGRPTWTDCDEAGDYVVPNVLSPRDLVFRPDNMDETVPHTKRTALFKYSKSIPTFPLAYVDSIKLLYLYVYTREQVVNLYIKIIRL